MRTFLLLLLATPLFAFPGEYPSRLPSAGVETLPQTGFPVSPSVSPPAFLPPLPIPEEGVEWALLDAQRLSPLDLPFIRWIWVPTQDIDDFRAISDVLNKVSQTAFVYRPYIHGQVCRVDLRCFYPVAKDLQRVIKLWENFQFDPWFSELLTKDLIEQLRNQQRELLGTKELVVVRRPGSHLSNGYSRLIAATQSLSPITHYAYFLARMTSTIKDKDGDKESVFSTIWGGLYYDFAGIRKSQIKGLTDLDQLLFDFGIGDGKNPFQKLFDDKLRSDARAGIGQSKVTGKPRRVDWFGTSASNISYAAGVVFITNDPADKDVDFNADPFKNLVRLKPAAFEVIWTRANGQQGYAIYDAQGKLLDEADQNAVGDRTVPSPYTTKLQSAISCIRCHGPDDGWQPFTNEVISLLPYVIGDVSQLNKEISDTNDRLRGWYRGTPRKPLMRARDDYAESVLRSTTDELYRFPWTAWKQSRLQTDVVRLVSKRISDIYALDRYNQVDAQQALRELGFQAPVDKQASVVRLNQLFPTGPIEDVTFLRIKQGQSVDRFKWSYFLNYGLTRAKQVRNKR